MSEIILDVQHLTKQYLKHTVVRDVSFQVQHGTICGLIGPNGAGKTTIMKALGGLITPTSGRISLFGENDEAGLAHARSRMCFLIETPYAKQEMTARENLKKLCMQKGIPAEDQIDRVLKLVGLSDTGKKQVRNFSLGMRQRLGIAGALLSNPEVMVLDEPVNGLDPEGIVEIRSLLLKLNREEHITILISSHLLTELSLLCTDYVIIRKGEVIRKITAEELKRECHEYFRISAADNTMLPAVLQNQLGITDFSTERDGSVRLYERTGEIALISRTLYENGIIPVEMHMHDANLEQYYMNLVGDTDVQHHEGADISDAAE